MHFQYPCILFSGHLIEDELASQHDREVTDKLMRKIAAAQEVSSLDDQYPLEYELHKLFIRLL